MLLQGKFTLKAPIQKVWDSILDPQTLLSCIPGAEKIERIDDKTYDCVVKQKVGPISVRFKFKAVLTEMEPPTHIRFVGEGDDVGKAGHFRHKTTVELKEISPGEVEIDYSSDVSIVGRLATFGDKVMRAKAKKLAEELTKRLQQRLEGLAS